MYVCVFVLYIVVGTREKFWAFVNVLKEHDESKEQEKTEEKGVLRVRFVDKFFDLSILLFCVLTLLGKDRMSSGQKW